MIKGGNMFKIISNYLMVYGMGAGGKTELVSSKKIPYVVRKIIGWMTVKR